MFSTDISLGQNTRLIPYVTICETQFLNLAGFPIQTSGFQSGAIELKSSSGHGI